MKTVKNKIAALIFLLIGIGTTIATHDATCLLFLGAVAVSLLFTKENWFYEDED